MITFVLLILRERVLYPRIAVTYNISIEFGEITNYIHYIPAMEYLKDPVVIFQTFVFSLFPLCGLQEENSRGVS